MREVQNIIKNGLKHGLENVIKKQDIHPASSKSLEIKNLEEK